MRPLKNFIKSIIFPVMTVCWLLPALSSRADPSPLLIPVKYATASITDDGVLHIETEVDHPCPTVIITASDGKWDLSGYAEVSMAVKNTGPGNATLCCRLDDYPEIKQQQGRPWGCIRLDPATSGTIRIPLKNAAKLRKTIHFIGMKKDPLEILDFDPANERKMVFYNPFTPIPEQNQIFEISNLQVYGKDEPFMPSTAQDFFPMIDKFGQYIHKEWPHKIHSVEAFQTIITQEEENRLSHSGPADRDQYGGWAMGPRLDATGFFRVEKYLDKWWLVDPAGYLFWSNGINVINTGENTPITYREHYFAQLPDKSSPSAEFYNWLSDDASAYYKQNNKLDNDNLTGSNPAKKLRRNFLDNIIPRFNNYNIHYWPESGYYEHYNQIKTYNFMGANLMKKYGANWRQNFLDNTIRRLHNWRINTLGNWSSWDLASLRSIPYVKGIAHKSKFIVSRDNKIKIFDAFDPSFRTGLSESLAREIGKSVDDPWCIGYFVDNEPEIGDEITLTQAVIMSPPEQKAKQVFVHELHNKYDSINNFNAVWGTSFSSWNALLVSTSLQIPPGADKKNIREDCLAFYTKTAETYFQTIREEIKKIAPNQLYLGCRFLDYNDPVLFSAARYCDVISFNLYRYRVDHIPLPTTIDKPVIIGEFHFGTLDSGMFWDGLKKAIDQKHRGELFIQYMLSALNNPNIIGAHWFQYWDQPTTGRFDGANCQIGFVDTCDTPYFEFIDSVRQVGNIMYNYRASGS